MYVSPMKFRALIIIGLVAATAVGSSACGSDDDANGTTDGEGTTAGTDLAVEGSVAGVTWTLVELDGAAPPME